MRVNEWQLWMHPYPTMIKNRNRRINSTLHPVKTLYLDGKELVNLNDMFEERRKGTPPQLKRCVRAVAAKEMEGKDSKDRTAARAAVSKGFAICTAQMQKSGYLKIGSKDSTKKGKTSSRSKAAQKDYKSKLAGYETLLAVARGESVDGNSNG